ncbi:MAG: hypothetical protein ABJP70_01645 [Erythrobacter sp.]
MTKLEKLNATAHSISTELHAVEAAIRSAQVQKLNVYAKALEWSGKASVSPLACQKTHKRFQESIALGFQELNSAALAHASVKNSYETVMDIPWVCPDTVSELEKESGDNVVKIAAA